MSYSAFAKEKACPVESWILKQAAQVGQQAQAPGRPREQRAHPDGDQSRRPEASQGIFEWVGTFECRSLLTP